MHTRQQACDFEEESEDHFVIESNEIADSSAVEAVKKSQKIGQ